MTLIFEMTPSLKFIASDAGKMWIKQEPQVLTSQYGVDEISEEVNRE